VADGAKLYPAIKRAQFEMIVPIAAEKTRVLSAAWPIDVAAIPQWYVAYTSANHEKRVAEQFLERSVEHFLPLYESSRQWKDRRMKLQLPLFPGYVFVRLPLCEKLKVLQVPGVARFVGFNGQAAVIAEKEVEALRSSTVGHLAARPHPYLTVGRRIRIQRGALAGVEGILIRRKNRLRVVLSVDLIMKSVSVEVDASDLDAT
jgi:transcription antitermination factor NusG